jgi:hypothetical protein
MEMRRTQVQEPSAVVVQATNTQRGIITHEYSRGVPPILPPLVSSQNPEFQFWSTSSFENGDSSSSAIVDGFSSRPDSPPIIDPFSSSNSFFSSRPNQLTSASGIFGSAVNLAETYPSFASAPTSPTSSSSSFSSSSSSSHQDITHHSSHLSRQPNDAYLASSTTAPSSMNLIPSPLQLAQTSSQIPPLIRSASPIIFGLADFMTPPRIAHTLDINEGVGSSSSDSGARGEHSPTVSTVSANFMSVDSSSSTLSVFINQ